jgi:NDP-sugar pyrophosphorylase family protein
MIRALNVFILAAGFGERLQPITHHIPKPLLPIAGRPVLEFILEKVITLPVNSIGINLHHKKKVIETWIKSSRFSKNIEIFPEESPLDTGGALKNAEEFLKESPFLVHNSDIMSDIDLAKLVDFHVTSKNFATLAVHDFPEFNSLSVDEQGFLREISMNQVQQDTGEKLAFTGIAVYDPDFFIFLKRGASSVVEAWKDAIAEGYGVKTLNVSGCYWRDIGTPSAYASAVFTALRDRGEIVYMHPSIEGCKHIEMNGYVVIENDCSLGEGVSLKNCIMLPKSTTEPSARHENCILGPGYSIDIEESEVVRLSEKDGRYLIGTGGSDRKYYRKERNGESVVVMQCLMDDTDFNNHIEYTRFFIEHSVPVPELKEIVPDTMSVVFEDLGDISLYSWLQCPREQGEIEEIYKKVLDSYRACNRMFTSSKQALSL